MDFLIRHIFFAYLGLVLFLGTMPAFAQDELGVVRYHTEEWLGVTNRDGTGLYHDIMAEIFGAHGLKVEVSYFPFKRSLNNVIIGAADLTGGTPTESEDYLMSRYPIWVSKDSALFHKRLDSGWLGLKTLRMNQAQLVAAPDLNSVGNVELYQVKTRSLALKMLLSGRKSYYLDDYTIIYDLVRGGQGLAFEKGESAEMLGDVDWSDYVVRHFKTSGWRMVFSKTERGERIREIFDAGFRTLYESGRLRELYRKWNLESVMVENIPWQ